MSGPGPASAFAFLLSPSPEAAFFSFAAEASAMAAVGQQSCAVMHKDDPKDALKSLSPMGRLSTVKDITDAVMYLTDAATVTGNILYVDGGAHFGRW